MRNFITIFTFFLGTPFVFGEMKVHRDLTYTKPKNPRQMLDIYAPTKGTNHPVVLWIHGGGWRKGDKSRVRNKPQAFVDKGYLFVSTNYRFVPDVTVKEMTCDIAKAIRWIHDHAKEYGGDPNSVFVMGHSAGAHLSALVCTDDRYLKAEGLSLSIIKGCVPVDTAAYDIPRRMATAKPLAAALYRQAFGKDKSSQKEFSPVTHVAKGKSIPPFLILHVADRPDSKAQSHMFADQLKDAGIFAEVVPVPDTTHRTINTNLGLPDDRPTQKLFRFLSEVIKE